MYDFFMTYRYYVSPTQLLKLLNLRFRWSLSDSDDQQKQVVQLRTFLCYRHWLENYYEIDFQRSKTMKHMLRCFIGSLNNQPAVHPSRIQKLLVLGKYIEECESISVDDIVRSV